MNTRFFDVCRSGLTHKCQFQLDRKQIMRRPRLHKSSIVIGALAAAALVLICLPGRVYDQYPGAYSRYEHGWPFIYLRRETEQSSALASVTWPAIRNALQTLPMSGVPWLSVENWKFWQSDTRPEFSRWEFSGEILAADIFVVMALLLAMVFAAEYRRRRRSSMLSVSLAELFVLLTAVCCVLGWVYRVRAGYRQEVAVITSIKSQDEAYMGSVKCIAPTWVSALFGNCWMPGFMWRTDSIGCNQDVSVVAELCDRMNALPYSNSLQLSGAVFGDGHYPFAKLRSIRRLETLSVSSTPRMDEQDVQELVQLSNLKKLVLEKSHGDPRLIRQLEQGLPGCTIVDEDENW